MTASRNVKCSPGIQQSIRSTTTCEEENGWTKTIAKETRPYRSMVEELIRRKDAGKRMEEKFPNESRHFHDTC